MKADSSPVVLDADKKFQEILDSHDSNANQPSASQSKEKSETKATAQDHEAAPVGPPGFEEP